MFFFLLILYLNFLLHCFIQNMKVYPVHLDYDALPTAGMLVNMFAGATSGIVENCMFYPLDTAKTRIQDLSEINIKAPKGTFGTLLQMLKEEGVTSVYKGFFITVVGSAPSHAAYFGFYELTKAILLKYSENSLVYGIAGVAATVTHDGIMLPAETIKQRMQVEHSRYKTYGECISRTLKEEGIRAFYRAYGTQLVMNIPFQSIHFMVYEISSKLLNPEKIYSPLVHCTAGAIAGGVAAAVTTPLDVCKTLLNTQSQETKVIGIKNAIKTIFKVAGPFGFFRGITARMLFIMPSTAICWEVYESMRVALRKINT